MNVTRTERVRRIKREGFKRERSENECCENGDGEENKEREGFKREKRK